MSNAGQADGSSLRDDSESIEERVDGSSHRDDSQGISEKADGSNHQRPD
jgi:hypothetical protein